MLRSINGGDVLGDAAAVTSPITATPFVGWRPEADLPTRKWLYGTHLIRGRVSVDVAAGGVGKTALKVGEALSMASGRPLFNKTLPDGPLNVWLFNLEDDMDELTRRLRAAAKYHGITEADLGGRLHVDSGLDQPCCVATMQPSGAVIAMPVVETLIMQILTRRIDVLIIDPFVSAHTVSENDNNAIDLVVKKAFVRIAHETECAINLVHHIRKGNGEDATADSARGASALIGAARSVQVFNRMSEDEAALAEIDPAQRKFYFRVTNEKANMAPPAEAADWYRNESVELDNGEDVGVARQFIWPAPKVASAFDIEAICEAIGRGSWRESSQCGNWAGHAIASVLGLDSSDKAGARQVKNILSGLVKNGTLKIAMHPDEKGRMKPFIEQNQ